MCCSALSFASLCFVHVLRFFLFIRVCGYNFCFSEYKNNKQKNNKKKQKNNEIKKRNYWYDTYLVRILGFNIPTYSEVISFVSSKSAVKIKNVLENLRILLQSSNAIWHTNLITKLLKCYDNNLNSIHRIQSRNPVHNRPLLTNQGRIQTTATLASTVAEIFISRKILDYL